MTPITIEWVVLENGSVAVLPHAELYNVPATPELQQLMDEMRKSEGYRSRAFTWRPYTYGEELYAIRQATTTVGDRAHVDSGLVHRQLLICSFGLSGADVDSLDPAIAKTLVGIMNARTYVPPERLDFFASKRTSSPVTESSTPQGSDAPS